MVQNTSDNRFGTAKWIVDPSLANGTHSTIAAALTSASSGETIFVRPGTYTENLTLKAGVNLTAYECDSGTLQTTANVTIIGKASFSAAGSVAISGIRLQTNSDYLLSVTGNAASLVNLIDCYLNITNNTGIQHSSSSANASIALNNCQGDIGTTGIAFCDLSVAGVLSVNSCYFYNTGATTTQSSIGGACMFFSFNSRLWFPILTTGISTAGVGIIGGYITTSLLNVTALTINATSGVSSLTNSLVSSGTASAISIGASAVLRMEGINEISCSNANIITGAGTLRYPGFTVSQSASAAMNVTTQALQTLRTGNLLTNGTVNLLTGTNAINVGTDAVQKAITFGNITGNTAVNINSGTSGSTYTTTNGIFALNTGTGTITLGNDAVQKSITLGNQTGNTSVTIDAGTGALNIGTAIAKTITLGNGTGATSVVVDCGTGALNLGANAIARTTTLGNTTGASVLALKYGTGDFTLASATGSSIVAQDTGEITMPLQPAFLAYASAAQDNVTGDLTNYTVLFQTEVFDRNSDFSSPNFTAPVTGIYRFSFHVQYGGIVSTNTYNYSGFKTTNRDYWLGQDNPYVCMRPDGLFVHRECLLCQLDAGDTAYVYLFIGNSGKGIDLGYNAPGAASCTFFAGELVC
jgi:hypothetical protein